MCFRPVLSQSDDTLVSSPVPRVHQGVVYESISAHGSGSAADSGLGISKALMDEVRRGRKEKLILALWSRTCFSPN